MCFRFWSNITDGRNCFQADSQCLVSLSLVLHSRRRWIRAYSLDYAGKYNPQNTIPTLPPSSIWFPPLPPRTFRLLVRITSLKYSLLPRVHFQSGGGEVQTLSPCYKRQKKIQLCYNIMVLVVLSPAEITQINLNKLNSKKEWALSRGEKSPHDCFYPWGQGGKGRELAVDGDKDK